MKFFLKILVVVILLSFFTCSVINEEKNEVNQKEESNINTIIGKWRCINYINDFLGTEKNSIYIFKEDKTGIHVNTNYIGGTGNLESFTWQIINSGTGSSLELNYSGSTEAYDFHFTGNKLIFNEVATFINIYSENVNFNNFPKESEPNHSNDTGNTIKVDDTHIYGELTSGDVDCFTFWGNTDNNYYLNIDFLSGSNCNLKINWYMYNYDSSGNGYWDNFAAVNNNGINLGEYDCLRLSGSGSYLFSVKINDINNNGCTYLISVKSAIKP